MDETKESSKIILKECNNDKFGKIIIIDNIEFFVPKLEILYSLKKAHIHRILPHTEIQEKNIKIWYEDIRNLCENGKKISKRLDEMIYESKLGDIKKNEKYDTENKLEYISRRIFLSEFEQVNKNLETRNLV